MSKKKVNPRRVPCSRADVARAKKQAAREVFLEFTAVTLTALLDRGIITEEQVHPAWEAISYKSESVSSGYCKTKELIKVLAEEYGIFLGGKANGKV